jgi:hypothetical protein
MGYKQTPAILSTFEKSLCNIKIVCSRIHPIHDLSESIGFFQLFIGDLVHFPSLTIGHEYVQIHDTPAGRYLQAM